ncbi:MAG TPA: hypothetical protein VMJ75_09040 [Candidatus Acidoferrales bacterium]|nr:hypothetical protein [Candidatus Acidoferrales bacterium]
MTREVTKARHDPIYQSARYLVVVFLPLFARVDLGLSISYANIFGKTLNETIALD